MADGQDDRSAKARDRVATEAAILEAARALLSEEGFSAFGINALARRAGCDKQLLYRYFGGLDGVLDAIGTDLATWIGDRLGPLSPVPDASYADVVETLLLRFLDALRADPLVQRIVAWEIADPNPGIARLAAARARALGAVVEAARGDRRPPPEADAAAVIAILVGAIQHLVLAGAASGRFVGLPLREEADWDRVRSMIRRIVAATLTP